VTDERWRASLAADLLFYRSARDRALAGGERCHRAALRRNTAAAVLLCGSGALTVLSFLAAEWLVGLAAIALALGFVSFADARAWSELTAEWIADVHRHNKTIASTQRLLDNTPENP